MTCKVLGCRAQVPCFQVGTPFLLTSEVSASVAEDMAEYEQVGGDWSDDRMRVKSPLNARFFQRCAPVLPLQNPKGRPTLALWLMVAYVTVQPARSVHSSHAWAQGGQYMPSRSACG